MSAVWHGVLPKTKHTQFFFSVALDTMRTRWEALFFKLFYFFFFCVLLRCIQKFICVRPVTHLMATGMAGTKNTFAWSVHARAVVCMVWAQWYTAHLARPDGIPVPIDV